MICFTSHIGLFLSIMSKKKEKRYQEVKIKENKGDVDKYEIRYRRPSERGQKYTF